MSPAPPGAAPGPEDRRITLVPHPACPHGVAQSQRPENRQVFLSLVQGPCLENYVSGRKIKNELNRQTDPLIVLFFDYLLNLLY